MVMVKHLPRDSAVQREIHGEAAEWSITDHLLAATVDHLAVANWMFACVNNGEDDETPEAPSPVPRPSGLADEDGAEDEGGAEPPTATEAPSPHAIARFFG
ncbi:MULTISPECIES: hypothetical protein [Streptomyces]|uniref:Uncharacterized protein n=1 Tax=Streptomyces venezuelae (strain ATCC 10712 / CBS 650.69 / DSM 40230 / JCM 4526 / NBRC 13096 / PD 04745) TaxID=953739 RepID=F2RJR4_STRVP|nr:hypothetical protein [Streptomyces venezuelae]APE23342.1 hypothetical protein vnz_21555 [Streptomyces venezuelae]QES00720.1 hypothetical protein DEJ43_21870 [Streptomyces venezuelae ATCC 10712]QES07809.1 hypothetical protein DEJ44_20835 [Streptomyces venezuelae]CCA57648.1 hypothetical protein SVEN_4362 [Streptomyces venezuelae ATCC 10712]